MISTFRTLPRKINIAFSGGVDSVVMLDIATKLNRDITLLTFNHQTETSEAELEIAQYYSKLLGINLITTSGEKEIPKGESKEKFWSEQRHRWFNSFLDPVCTGHHLNDAAEWYLMSAIADGKGGFLMNYWQENVIRPLIIVSKERIVNYADENRLKYITDPTNKDVNFNKRNKVRAELLPKVLEINPGFLYTIRKRINTKEAEK